MIQDHPSAVEMKLTGSNRMPIQKTSYQSNDPIGHILQQIVAGVVEQVIFGIWKPPAPFIVIIHVENEIVPTPQDQHGDMGQCAQVPVHPGHDIESGITGCQGDILDEAQGGQPVLRAIIGREKALFHLGGQPFSRCQP